jgi:hypothetical protein
MNEGKNTRRRIAKTCFWAGLLVAGLGWIGLLAPADAFYDDLSFTLDAESARKDQGHAWLVTFEEEGMTPSGGGYTSKLVLMEDGVPFERDDNHSRLREQGGGRFSHWAKSVWFAPADDSDPRTSGRSYEMVLPHGEKSSLHGVVPHIAALGGLLALIGLALAPRPSRGVVLVVVVLTAVFSAGDDIALYGLVSAVKETQDRVDVVATVSEATPERVGNVTRLAMGEFSANGTSREPDPPVSLALEPRDVNQAKDGVLRLLPGKGGLHGTTDREVRAMTLAEIVVAGRILEGDSLRVEIVREDNGKVQRTEFELPVSASPDPQLLRIVRPLGLYSGSAVSLITEVSLSMPHTSKGRVMLAIDDISLIDEMAVYRSRTHGEERFQSGKTMRPAFWQSVTGTFRVPWPEDAGALAKGSFALRHGNRTLPATVQVAVEHTDGSVAPLGAATLTGHDGWVEWRNKLPSDAEPDALLLTVSELPEDGVLAWAGWRVVDDSRPPRRVLLTLMDTLRADMLSAYDAEAPATPRLDALAAEGVLFERCVSQCYWTRPSMASIMSSRFVQGTGVHVSSQRLPGSYHTLAELMSAAGFYTVGTVSNSNAASDAGMDQGWDEFQEQWVTPELSEAEAYCAQMVEPRLPDLLEEDLLVYVHLMDAHGPYGPVEAPADWTPPTEGERLPFDAFLDRPWNPEPTAASRIAWYRDDVSRMDAGWGRFLDRTLERWERDDAPPAVVAIMSDHGEFLGEDGQWSHINYDLRPAVVHVPLIIRAPGRLPEGERVATAVQNVDVAPTLLELLDVPTDGLTDWDGRSLVALAEGGGDDRQAISSGGPGAGLFAIYSEDGALLGKEQALDDLLGPDGESLPIPGYDELSESSIMKRFFARRLQSSFLDTWGVYRERGDAIRDVYWAGVDQTASVLDPDALKQLEEMGYLAK